MKTIYFSKNQLSNYLLFGIVAFAFSSCGSYQNSSYYDRDGIYNSQDKQINPRQDTNNQTSTSQNNQYKDYFGSLQNDKVEIFTDVDNYNNSTSENPQNNQGYNSGYSGWGTNPDNVTVNVYGNNLGYNYWNAWYGPNWAWNSWYGGPYWSVGWNSWYGPSWGWNNYYSPYSYGCGYYGNNYNYGYLNNYAYHGGRRGTSYNGGLRGENSTRYSSGRRSYSQTNTGVRNSGTRTYSTTSSGVRTQSTGPRTNTYPTQGNNGGVRQTASPTRSYTPNTNGGGGVRSSGTTYSSGSYGGGTRSSGGGRR